MISDIFADMGCKPTEKQFLTIEYTDDKGNLTGEKGTWIVSDFLWQQLKHLLGGKVPNKITMKKSDCSEKGSPLQNSIFGISSRSLKSMGMEKSFLIMPTSGKKINILEPKSYS